ncbi:small ribosomal subunit protein mS34-like [Tubulanus polymorphus]|uniref:small ribosomal subunit protein mS34-like n=1 Tax=Tubulanus polymorphus TaxID=672921 RepID=UPI003DA62B8C
MSTPIKYIGRSARDYYGKTLFEILCQLKGFGVGRMVIRESTHFKYSEPSYYIVKDVVPKMSDNTRRSGYAMMDFTFRGVPMGVKKICSGYKPDWRLVAKHEEEQIKKNDAPVRDKRIAPSTTKFPPLMEKMILRDLEKMGKEVTTAPVLKISIRQTDFNYVVQDSNLSTS